MRLITPLAAAAMLALGTTLLAAAPSEAELLATLSNPNATDNARVTAAQQLGDTGTHAAVAPLVKLLESDKPHLRDAARYGLENNACPSVEGVLLDAAGRLSGPARIGVVQSLGQRGTDKSVPALAKFAVADEPALAAAAADALGKIGTPAAFTALRPGLGKCPAAASAYLKGAQRLAVNNDTAAAKYYRELSAVTENIPGAVKQGALRGAMLTGGPDGLALWEKAIANENDPAAVDAALRVVVEYPASADATATFVRALAKLTAGMQERLAEALAARGDKAAIPALKKLAVQLATVGNEPVRLAAARALTTLGDSSDAAESAFNLLLASGNDTVATTAQNALRGLSYQTPAGEAAAGFKPMFNGENLDDWRGGDGWWSVVNGVLTAESTAEKPCKQNSHLFWKGGEKGDFELRAEARLSRDANSGIQLRAADKNSDTSYQADMNGAGDYIGFLYHPAFHLIGERGASVILRADGTKTTAPFASKNALPKYAFKTGTWNEYRIVARGRSITLYVNGIKTSEFTDERADAPAKGFITLQMHAGPPMKIEFRNLRLRDL